MGSEYEILICHTEFLWLYRGKILRRLFQLRDEITISLSETKTSLTKYFSDVPWLQLLAYLGDICNELKEFSLSIQCHRLTALTFQESVRSEAKS
jgi:hypothetical protein